MLSLGVRVTEATALPFVTWHGSDQTEELFGLPLTYFNPYHFDDRPYRDTAACVGFYEVREGSGDKEIVCEVSRNMITAIVLLPFTPKEAMSLFETQGWLACEKKAARIIYPSRQEIAAAVAI